MSLVILANSIQLGQEIIHLPGSTALSIDTSGIRSSTGATIQFANSDGLIISVNGIKTSNSRLFPFPSEGITVSGNVLLPTPNQPTGLLAFPSSATSIVLSWNSMTPINNTFYRIERSLDSETWSIISDNTTVTTFVDTGLVSGQTYHYRVTALNSVGPSPPSQTVSATTWTVPGTPGNVVAMVISSTQVNLIYSTNNGGTPITAYRIERSADLETWSIISDNTTVTTFADTGLVSGQTYHYRVTALNSVGPSSPSETVSATTWTVPSTPGNVVATVISSTQINVTYSQSTTNGGTPITAYRIERSLDLETWSTMIENMLLSITTFGDIGLSPGTFYSYRVSAVNSVGPSLPSETVSARTWIEPDAPSITVNSVSSTSVSFHISQPSFDGGTPITDYQIWRNGTSRGTVSVSTSFYSDLGLSQNTLYVYSFAALNAVGYGIATTVEITTSTELGGDSGGGGKDDGGGGVIVDDGNGGGGGK
jgi:fibronectin type 3 domain-containing protein